MASRRASALQWPFQQQRRISVDRLASPSATSTVFQLTSTGIGTFKSEANPGAARYELYFTRSGNNRLNVSAQDTTYTTDYDHSFGWQRAGIRGIASDGTAGSWSSAVSDHLRRALKTPTVDVSTSARCFSRHRLKLPIRPAGAVTSMRSGVNKPDSCICFSGWHDQCGVDLNST
jgi:hypothetical protein